MNRFKWWAIGVFSSVLVLLTLLYNFYGNKEFGSQDILILCLYTPTIVFSIGGFFTSLCFDGKTKILSELVLILLNLIVWIIITIATLIGTSKVVTPSLERFSNLVVGSSRENNNIVEPNIYFFSFGSLINAVYLASSWFKQWILHDEHALTTTQWTFLATSGFLVMATGISLYGEDSCKTDENTSCGRTLMSILIGLVSGVVSCVLIPWRSAPLKCQAELALILLVTWAIAIAILTFDTGPAVYINTMYFGICVSFVLALNIISTTVYADSILEASPYSQVQYGRTESQRENDALGAAGFLDMAFANMTQPQPVDSEDEDDPRIDAASLFESVGGSLASMKSPKHNDPEVQRDTKFNETVIVGKRDSSRVEIWFILFVESILCFTVFYKEMNENQAFKEQWIVFAPALSMIICFFGWFISSIKKKYMQVIEGILIFVCVCLWGRGLVSVTFFFNDDDAINGGGMKAMTAHQLFMSYGSFFTSLYLLTNWSNASATTTDWIFLCAASSTIFGILFIGNDGIFGQCDWRIEFESCGQLQLVTALSLGSACISFVMFLVSFVSCGKVIPLVHVAIGTALLAMWCAGSYFIVFEREGVGTEIGPTFFACWGSLFFCVDIATTNVVLLCKERLVDDDNEEAEDEDAQAGSVSSLRDEITEENQRLNTTNEELGVNVVVVDDDNYYDVNEHQDFEQQTQMHIL